MVAVLGDTDRYPDQEARSASAPPVRRPPSPRNPHRPTLRTPPRRRPQVIPTPHTTPRKDRPPKRASLRPTHQRPRHKSHQRRRENQNEVDPKVPVGGLRIPKGHVAPIFMHQIKEPVAPPQCG